jgi:hypothetical protein
VVAAALARLSWDDAELPAAAFAPAAD